MFLSSNAVWLMGKAQSHHTGTLMSITFFSSGAQFSSAQLGPSKVDRLLGDRERQRDREREKERGREVRDTPRQEE